jgi:alkanesulfonate monooxygenase SsuD/methylene tetrahydromethanopterin reductase-like flavin-dependent oxidoreductase (luciferase family)
VLAGAYSEAALRRAARLGDGFFGSARDASTALQQLATVQRALEEAGRTSAGFDLTTGLGADLSPSGVERMEAAGYTRIQAGILSGEDPFGDLKRLRRRFGSLMTR